MNNSLKKFEKFKVDSSSLISKLGGGCASHCFELHDALTDCGMDSFEVSHHVGQCFDSACA